MSSRDGTVVLLDDLVREATQRALDVVREKNPDLDEVTMKDVAEKVAIGAIKFPMISRENNKIVTFDWDSALDFNGQSAPYIQYANVRAISLLRRADSSGKERRHLQLRTESSEINLIESFPSFRGRGHEGCQGRTSILTAYAYDLAKAFNDFYNQRQVLKAEDNVRNSALALVEASRIALEKVLNLLASKPRK